jgi:hypothetical protein
MRTALRTTVLLTFGVALAGCSTTAAAEAPPAVVRVADVETGSVGRLSAPSGLVGVVANGSEVVAYVCDGELGIGERFAGTLDPTGRAELTSATGAVLTVTIAGTEAEGTFRPTAGAAPIAFTTTAATGEAGVYLADGMAEGVRWGAGWVVLSDGTQDGSARENGVTKTVPAVTTGPAKTVPRTVQKITPAPTTPTAKPKPKPDREELRKDAAGRAKRITVGSLDPTVVCVRLPSRCPA